MAANTSTLKYLQGAVTTLIERGRFRTGDEFRPTQRDALYAYRDYLNSETLTDQQKLKGFFELPTGIGKTALFLSILDEAHRAARAVGDHLKAMIVVPTITLLKQMKGNEDEIGDIEKWAPDYLDTVGFYGGNYRTLGKELTVMIYNSWVKLMEDGKISSSNFDIIVSDEAHRGISERRITNQFNAFDNGAAQIAFTATARFDEEKSVEQSHARKIFGRSIAESVCLGELSEYIQTQLYVVRVVPQDLQEKFGQATDNSTAIRLGMRQDAWMRQMVEVFKKGRDEHTGDLLSDNKAGFYVGDIAMSDRMASILNADPDLRKRAKVAGKSGVAVSIHSLMPPREQDEMLRAFKRGEYMACISDSKLKEGFDDPSLKTIFDYPRGSLVDKAQIVGRGARKWWNEAKQRYEGCTFVDSIVYIGAEDPKEDKALKEDAIRSAVMAWTIIEGTHVFAPFSEPSIRPKNPSSGGGSVQAVHGLAIESHINLEDLQAIYSGQKELQERTRDSNIIDITPEMHALFLEERKRTKVGSRTIVRFPDVPDTLNGNHAKIENWRTGRSKTALKDEWDWLIRSYQNIDKNESGKEGALGKIDFTDEMHAELIKLRKSVGIGTVALLKSSDNIPDGLTEAKVQRMVLNRDVAQVKQSDWDWLIGRYRDLAKGSEISSKGKGWVLGKDDPDAILLSDAMHASLLKEKERTGMGIAMLLKSSETVPENIIKSKIDGWFRHRGKTYVQADEWKWVMNQYKSMPDKVGWSDENLPAPKANF